MKLLLVLLVVLFGVWLWRSRRLSEGAPPQRTARSTPELQNMVTCQVCGLHLPAIEAVTTARGMYCGEAHRQQAEK
jgi:uncharacterized protein